MTFPRLPALLALISLQCSVMPALAQDDGGRGMRGRHGAESWTQQIRGGRHMREADGENGMAERRERMRAMSVEERRQLRRDIRDAGRDIYGPRPGPGAMPHRMPRGGR